jgi:simple sugar transport system permease protein
MIPAPVRKVNPVPIVFLALVVVCVWWGGLNPWAVLSQVLTRFDRYAFLCLALIIPVVAGLGLNFGIVIGAMAGQAALLAVTSWGIGGIGGFLLACVIAVPLAIGVGLLVGLMFNRARGKEMITGLIAGYFANGLYQLLFLFGVGTIIPFHDPVLLVPRGEGAYYGYRVTVDLAAIHHTVDGALAPSFVMGVVKVRLSLVLYALVAFLCLGIWLFLRTKLGQEFRAMGQDSKVAEIYGIRVNRNRIIATVISTVLAAWGQMLYLQNLGNMNTYSSHELVGMFSIASILMAGATVERATIWHALGGVLLFHSLYVALPQAAARIFEDSLLGEYFRTCLMYGVIAISIAVYAIRKRRA